MGLVSVLCATVMRQHLGLGLGLIALTMVGYGVMGALIYLRSIPSVVVTMGMSFVWMGIGYLLQPGPGGQPPDWLIHAFNVHLIVPESVLIVIAAGLLAFLFYRSGYGDGIARLWQQPSRRRAKWLVQSQSTHRGLRHREFLFGHRRSSDDSGIRRFQISTPPLRTHSLPLRPSSSAVANSSAAL